jgi:N-acetylmuramoyl-L-alanine amidase
MSKLKKIVLCLLCLAIIGGVLYAITYMYKVNGRYVQDTKNKNVNINNTNKPEVVIGKDAQILYKAIEKIKTQENKSPIEKRSDRIIVIDPGHASTTNLEKEQLAPGSNIMKIKEPGGAQGVITRTPEYVVNMAVAVRLRTLLKAKGYTVIMTKTENKQILGNIARAKVGNDSKADLVIRIHADSNNDSSIMGASMLIPTDSKNTNPIYKVSKKYGQVVFKNLIENIGMKNRGVVERNDITGFNWSKVPVILVEMGFLSNIEEDKELATGIYQDKLAKALSEGIDKALMD